MLTVTCPANQRKGPFPVSPGGTVTLSVPAGGSATILYTKTPITQQSTYTAWPFGTVSDPLVPGVDTPYDPTFIQVVCTAGVATCQIQDPDERNLLPPFDWLSQTGYIGSPGSPGMIGGTIVTTNQTFTSNQTFSGAIYFWGGTWTINSGVTVTVNGPMFGADYQWFNCIGTGRVTGNPDMPAMNPLWWGADATFTNDSSAALDACFTFCVGVGKPAVQMSPGRYKVNTPITITDSIAFLSPMIYGVRGGTNQSAEYTCVLDGSASALTSTQAVLRIVGASGHISSGGIDGVQIRGNGVCIGLQISGQTGFTVSNCRLFGSFIQLDIYNEFAAAAAEYIIVRDTVLECPTSLEAYGMNLHIGAGTESFHGLHIDNCWFNLPKRTHGIRIDDGVLWYDGYLDAQFFMDGTSYSPQYCIKYVDGPGTPKPTLIGGGAMKIEGGGGLARLCTNQDTSGCRVFYGGSITGIGAIQQRGQLYLVDESCRMGTGPGNGNTMFRFRRYSLQNRSLTSVSTVAIFGLPAPTCLIDMMIESAEKSSTYAERHTGVAEFRDNGSGVGRWLEFGSSNAGWLITDTFGYGASGLTVNANAELVISNANFPARIQSALLSTHAASSTVLMVSGPSVSSMTPGRHMFVELDTGEDLFSAIVTSNVAASTITISSGIYSQATVGNDVFVYAAYFRYNVTPLAEAYVSWGAFAYTQS